MALCACNTPPAFISAVWSIHENAPQRGTVEISCRGAACCAPLGSIPLFVRGVPHPRPYKRGCQEKTPLHWLSARKISGIQPNCLNVHALCASGLLQDRCPSPLR